jgi:hypothetical protein
MRNQLRHIFAAAMLAAVIGVFLPDRASAQIGGIGNNRGNFDNNGFGGNTDAFGNPVDQYGNPIDPNASQGMQIGNQDSTKKKIRKPLESYFFDDSIRKREIFVWNVDTYRNKVRMIGLDTMLNSKQPDYPFLKKDVGDAYQGNMGGASIPLNYFNRPQYRNYEFAQAFYAYFFEPESARFFNVKKPFTHFSYYTAGQTSRREEGFYINHAQNISPSTGFNVDYESKGTRGFYQWGKGRAKDLSVAFSHTGKKYSIHAGYIFNTINNKENGGMLDDRNITDTIFEQPSVIPVNLNDARTIIRNNAYYIVQSYGVPLSRLKDTDFSIADKSSIFFGHALVYSRWNKVYSDTKEASGDFYSSWYINPTATYDSISESLLSNRIFLQIQPWDRDGVVGLIDAGVGMDNHRYSQFVPGDFLRGGMKKVDKTDYYIYGSVDGKISKYFDWGGDAEFHPAGYRMTDLKVGARASVSAFIKGKPLTLSGKFTHETRSAGYWASKLFSNHYVWSNSFNKENETRVELSFKVPSWALELGAAQSMLSNKIYYDADARPAQYSGAVSVSGLYAQKDFRIGGLHLNHRVLLQWSTQDKVVPVPLFSAYLSYYFEFNVVKDVLRAQVGFDARYNTPYYAFGYSPATATFYNQREKQVGGYPLVDFYITGKWKRMRILLKLEHMNDGLFGGRNYFTLLHYPLQKMVFKYGMSWAFYD